MNQFEMLDKSESDLNKYTPEKVQEHISIYKGTIESLIKILKKAENNINSKELALETIWTQDGIKSTCESIINFLDAEIKVYSNSIIDESENIEKNKRRIDILKEMISELKDTKNIPNGFVEKLETTIRE